MKGGKDIKVEILGMKGYIHCAELCGFNIFRLAPDNSKFLLHSSIVKTVLEEGKLEGLKTEWQA